MTRLRWIAYERELERYGGPAAIGIAESVFQASSDAVLGLLRNPEAPTRAARLGIAILTMLATLRECFEGREAIARFVRDYGVAYLRGATGGDPQRSSALGRAFAQGFSRQATELREQVQATWQSLETGCVLGGEGASALSAYLQALAGARRLLQARCAAGEIAVHGVVTRSWEACAPRLVPSYVHMMNNRLGISVLEEAYLAHLVLWALTDNANEVQHAGGREAHAVGSPSTNGHAC